jgi:hypothetical protein
VYILVNKKLISICHRDIDILYLIAIFGELYSKYLEASNAEIYEKMKQNRAGGFLRLSWCRYTMNDGGKRNKWKEIIREIKK